jgi:hypothetical protein
MLCVGDGHRVLTWHHVGVEKRERRWWLDPRGTPPDNSPISRASARFMTLVFSTPWWVYGIFGLTSLIEMGVALNEGHPARVIFWAAIVVMAYLNVRRAVRYRRDGPPSWLSGHP